MKAPTISAPTGGMGRRGLRVLGVFILLLNLALLFVFGFDVLTDPSRFVQVALGVLGGLLLIGATVDLPWNVEPHRLAGVGYLCLASSYLFANVPAFDGIGWVAITVIGALSIGFIGFDIARDGRHFNIDLDA
ncbi:hypothetical protein SAMN05421858_0477 [Haladaptatus litoreus]|uniref:SPW repeat-containing protein n=1 Tax=Haladaptatus litoreus TaxID=553468 RepID=A0A1N6VTE7_9EURY|nr:hypothetical protein [Haladaptatus litoreus]SIQ81094.1 hypothetical protein SAMN05421858_0477 [Haladaptatus litoreus]